MGRGVEWGEGGREGVGEREGGGVGLEGMLVFSILITVALALRVSEGGRGGGSG